MRYSIQETNGKKTYRVNDVHYERLEDVPAQYRHLFEDKNNDGVPDGFEFPIDMSSPWAMIKSLLSGGKQTRKSKPQSVNQKMNKDVRSDGYNRGKEDTSIKPTLIKIFVVSAITLTGFWVYQVYNAQTKDASNDPGVVIIEPESNSENDASSGVDKNQDQSTSEDSDIKIYLEDPNVEPYRVFISVKINDETLLTMNAPESMSLSDTPGNTILEFTSDAEQGTTLSGKTLTYSVSRTPCQPDPDRFERSRVNLGGAEFVKGINDEGAAGHRYVTYAYALERLDRCILITLEFNLVNPTHIEGSLSEYDIKKDIIKLENDLAQIEFP